MDLMLRTCSTEKMNLERIFARLFIAGGGILWTAAAFGAGFRYEGKTLGESVGSALIPLAATVVALAIGWFYEKLAALLLALATVAVVVWGLMSSWESGVWLLMTVILIAPMAIAALLFMLASRMQNICTLEGALPE